MIAYHRVGYRVYFGVRSGAFLEVFVDPVHPLNHSISIVLSRKANSLTHIFHLSSTWYNLPMIPPALDTTGRLISRVGIFSLR